MDVRTGKRVVIAVCAVLMAFAFFSMAVDDDLKATSASDMVFYVTFVLAMLGVAAFAYFVFRCPQCGRHLSRQELNVMKCSVCGCSFTEPRENRESV